MRLPFGLGRKKAEAGPPAKPTELSEFYLQVKEYVNRILSGGPEDADFEAVSLSKNGFNNLGLALILLSVANENDVPSERLAKFMTMGTGPHLDTRTPTLIRRLAVLIPLFSEAQCYALIDSGAVGDRQEICPIRKDFDDVSFVVKMSRVVKGLKGETIFD